MKPVRKAKQSGNPRSAGHCAGPYPRETEATSSEASPGVLPPVRYRKCNVASFCTETAHGAKNVQVTRIKVCARWRVFCAAVLADRDLWERPGATSRRRDGTFAFRSTHPYPGGLEMDGFRMILGVHLGQGSVGAKPVSGKRDPL